MTSDAQYKLSLEDALAKARSAHSSIDGIGATETDRYWAFPVQEIGCCGVVVEKASGLVTPLGSVWPFSTWLWGYEKGLVTEEPIDLLVEEVTDLDRTVEILQKLRISPPEGRRAALQKLPALFRRSVTWMALGELATDNGSSFKWKIQK